MTYISDARKWAFVHIPKSGSNAVYAYLNHHRTVGDIAVMDHLDHGLPLHQHSYASEIIEWMGQTGRDWEEYSFFAVVRDPLTRPQSAWIELHRNWTWAKRLGGDQWWKDFVALQSVEEFVISGMYDPEGPNYMTHQQMRFVTSPDGDQVCRVVDLEAMATTLPRILSLPGTVPLVHKGAYHHEPLSSEATEVIHRRYEPDFDLHALARKRL